MSADCAVTRDLPDHAEFATCRKTYHFDVAGSVSMWGERVGDDIGPFRAEKIRPQSSSIDDLADSAGGERRDVGLTAAWSA